MLGLVALLLQIRSVCGKLEFQFKKKACFLHCNLSVVLPNKQQILSKVFDFPESVLQLY